MIHLRRFLPRWLGVLAGGPGGDDTAGGTAGCCGTAAVTAGGCGADLAGDRGGRAAVRVRNATRRGKTGRAQSAVGTRNWRVLEEYRGHPLQGFLHFHAWEVAHPQGATLNSHAHETAPYQQPRHFSGIPIHHLQRHAGGGQCRPEA